MKWLRRCGIALAGLLVAVGFAMLGRDGRRAKKAERRTEELLSEGTEKALKKAVRETAKAENFKAQAMEAAKAGQAAIDKIGAKDKNMAEILSTWNADRVDHF